MPRETKVHFSAEAHYVPLCGTSGQRTARAADVTCRRCQFAILAGVAPWARPFLDELRQLIGCRELPAVVVPGALAKPVDSKVKGLGDGFTRAFAANPRAQKAVRELLSVATALQAAIQPVMDYGGPPAEPVGVKEGQVAEQPGNAGQIRDKAHGND